jgi:integrase/recombinase XerD
MIKKEEFERYLSVRRDFKPSSIETVWKKLNLYLAFHQSKYALNRYDESFEAFIFGKKNEGLLNNSLNTYVTAFNLLGEFLEYKKVVSVSRFPHFKKNHTHIDPLTPDEEQKIIDSEIEYGSFRGLDCSRMNLVYRAFTRLLSTTGCRFDEAARLEINDVYTDYVILRKTKNRDDRKAYITEPLVRELKELCKDRGGLVFTNMTGNKLHPQDYITDLKMRGRKVGIQKRVHPHVFRHSFGTEIKRRGGDIQDIKELLGHRDIKSSERYIQLANDHLKNIAMRHRLNSINADPVITIEQAENMLWSLFKGDTRFDQSMVKESIALLWKSVKAVD